MTCRGPQAEFKPSVNFPQPPFCSAAPVLQLGPRFALRPPLCSAAPALQFLTAFTVGCCANHRTVCVIPESEVFRDALKPHAVHTQ